MRYKNTSKLLKSIRSGYGLSQIELAKKAGFKSPQHLSNIETGHAPMPSRAAARISRSLNIDFELFVSASCEDYKMRYRSKK